MKIDRGSQGPQQHYFINSGSSGLGVDLYQGEEKITLYCRIIRYTTRFFSA